MGTKQYRKLIKIGESSLGIVLPIGWLRFHNLVSGDKLKIITNEDIIIKRVEGADKNSSIKLS
jgi:hypothetical protein